MADTIKCPNCAANLMFEPSSGKLECAYCGGSFDPAKLETIVEELTAEPKKTATAPETDNTVQPEPVQPELTPSEDGDDDDNPLKEDAEDSMQFTCKSCAGTVISSANTSASFCPFCGSPSISSWQ